VILYTFGKDLSTARPPLMPAWATRWLNKELVRLSA
jgi:hypothetical protein